MEVKSISNCLDRIDNMIFDKSLKFMLQDNLELIRNHIEWQQVVCISRGESFEEKIAFLSVIKPINHIIERFYTDDTEEELDVEYNKLRHKILEWFETIITKLENKN